MCNTVEPAYVRSCAAAACRTLTTHGVHAPLACIPVPEQSGSVILACMVLKKPAMSLLPGD